MQENVESDCQHISQEDLQNFVNLLKFYARLIYSKTETKAKKNKSLNKVDIYI